MPKGIIHELNEFGQSIWLDNINRFMIETGELKWMLGLGLRGMTSNPTIFDKAISSTADYDGRIKELCKAGKSTFEIYDDLTTRDVRDAADIFLPVYEESGGLDGYVSLEINPHFAYKSEETIKEGKRLFKKVNRPNVMFKVPATEAGLKAIEELVASGMNINATLIFSVEQYADTANAYIRGIKRLLQIQGDVRRIRSVASVFVSRIDTFIDKLLDNCIGSASLKGKAAVANSKLIYKKFLDIFSSAEFAQLKDAGANLQRALWGSTSTKNPAYSDIKYVTELIGKNTVNTMPEQTFKAFLEHGTVKEALTCDVSDAQETLEALKKLGIDINYVCAQLLKEGVAAFTKSFDSLLNSLDKKLKTGTVLNSKQKRPQKGDTL